MKINGYRGALLMMLVLLSLSCKDFITIEAPLDQTVTQTVYNNDETAISAVRGIYAKVMSGGFADGSVNSVTLLAGRSADDFINYNSNENLKQFYQNNLLANNSSLRTGLWQSLYQIVYASNAVLENLGRSTRITAQVKSQLQGEAKFVRAFCHFYLTNLFGEVPYILTTDYRLNSVAAAWSVSSIYTQLVNDLNAAITELSENYPSADRIRANKWAAKALLARVYLYNDEWANAESQASEIIAHHTEFTLLSDLNQVFLRNSEEAILQFAVPSTLGVNTNEGAVFILNAAPTVTTEVIMSSELISAFEAGDQRLDKWVGIYTSGNQQYHYPFKYKVKTGSSPSEEYSMVFRLAEQYLIRAEARINQNKIASGIEDLNVIRARARPMPNPNNYLPTLPPDLSKQAALLATEQERRIEFFSEWGHRWLDLKRTGRADAVLKVLKSPYWQSTDVIYPIPATELLNNSNLKQNPGYN